MFASARRFIEFGKGFLSPKEFHVKDPSLWHAKLYLYWLATGGMNGPGYKENFCHYWRVVLLWAPRRWFSHSVAGRVTRIAASIFWQAMWPARKLLVLMWQPFAPGVRRLGGWFSEHADLVGRIWVCAIALEVLVVIGVLAYAIYKQPLLFAIILGAFVALVVVIVMAIIACQYVQERRLEHRRFMPEATIRREEASFLDNVSGTVQLVAQFAIARKRRICPFVTFDFNVDELVRLRTRGTSVAV